MVVQPGPEIAVAGDGQVTLGDVVMKHHASKVRRLFHDQVVVGFAGSVSDAFTLFDKFERQLEQHQGNLVRSAVELGKEWRTDRYLRHLDAMLVVAGEGQLLLLSGDGDVIEPDDGLGAIGSGGPYALAAARALTQHTAMSPREVAVEALRIAASMCVYTNTEITVETLPGPEEVVDARG